MSKYEKQLVSAFALQVGDIFEHPLRDDTICKVEHASLNQDDHCRVKIVGYVIVEGALHWPVIYMPPDAEITLLLPTTTTVVMSGKSFIDSLIDQHGVTNGQGNDQR